MVTDSQVQNSSPVQNRHILPQVLIIQNHFSMVSTKRHSVFSIKLRSEAHQVKHRHTKSHSRQLILASIPVALPLLENISENRLIRCRLCSLKIFLLKFYSFSVLHYNLFNFNESLIILQLFQILNFLFKICILFLCVYYVHTYIALHVKKYIKPRYFFLYSEIKFNEKPQLLFLEITRKHDRI